MCDTNEAVPVLLLPLPSISGPTIGVTWWLEWEEWGRQIRRWIVGSSESFHYFLIHWRGKPLLGGIAWFLCFFNYYAVLLCSAGIFTLLAGFQNDENAPEFSIINNGPVKLSISLASVPLASLCLQYIVFGIGFIIDRRAVRMMTVKEDISLARNLTHWLLAPPTLLVYSMVAFYAIAGFIFKGKKMAKHDMAAKAGLAANTVAASGEAVLTPFVNPEGTDEQDYDSSQRHSITRSTSVTKQRSDSLSMSKQRVMSGLQISDLEGNTGALLCDLPERFFFGNFSEAT